MSAPLKAPFPWFGGKSRAASEVSAALGEVTTYCEPFAGSLGVLLQREPVSHEVVNDADGWLVNFWRAVKHAPDEVAHYADWPVTEADLTARHWWLLQRKEVLRELLAADPDAYDAKAAGWWVWGICAWIGSGWCSGEGPWSVVGAGEDARLVKDAGRGINRQLPHLGTAGQGINRQLPHLGTAGQGINRKLPHLGTAGQGINRKLPHLGNAGRGINRQASGIHEWFAALSERLRRVRVCNGDFARVLSDSVLHLGSSRTSVVGVLLDPPYPAGRQQVGFYAGQDGGHAEEVWSRAIAWAEANGARSNLRIVVCGYDGLWAPPLGWTVRTWRNTAGYRRDGQRQEVLWCSPHCVPSGSSELDTLL